MKNEKVCGRAGENPPESKRKLPHTVEFFGGEGLTVEQWEFCPQTFTGQVRY